MNNLEKIRTAAEVYETDAVLITSKENRRYVTGFSGSNGYVVITKDKALLITDFRYTQQAAEQAPDFEIIKYDSNIVDHLKKVLEGLPIKTVGYETDKLTDKEVNLFRNSINLEFVPIDGLCVPFREVKEPHEIEKIKKAASIADRAFNNLLNLIKPGVSEKELALELEYLCGKAGGEGQSFGTIVASGYRSAMAHATPSEKLIQDGEPVTIDFGVIVDGYMSDMTRTVCVGKLSEKMQVIFDTVMKAQDAALKAVKTGITCEYLDSVHRQIFLDAGLEQYSLRSLGHGVGLEIHESPRIAVGSKTLIRSGMVITIEPGLYVEGLGGVRTEDLVVVTDNGYEMLSSSPGIINL